MGGYDYLDMPISRFSQAYDRARSIAADVFDDSRAILGLVASWPDDDFKDMWAPAADGFQVLEQLGFKNPPLAEWAGPSWPYADPEVSSELRWRAFDLSSDPASRAILLWCATSNELSIQPQAPVLSHLLDPDRNVLLYVYDHRGMDVTALDPDALTAVYHSRESWILDYDRPRIDAAFGSPGPN